MLKLFENKDVYIYYHFCKFAINLHFKKEKHLYKWLKVFLVPSQIGSHMEKYKFTRIWLKIVLTVLFHSDELFLSVNPV